MSVLEIMTGYPHVLDRPQMISSSRKSTALPAFSLTNARLVLPQGIAHTSLVVRDGIIHRINATHAATARRTDCEGDFLLPGLIEVHTDNIERHIEPRPGSFWRTDRAVLSHDAELAAAGITTAFNAITLGGDTSDEARQRAYLDAINSIAEAESEGLLRVEHRLHLRCELGHAQLRSFLATAIERRTPQLMSMMEHVPGQGQWTDITHFREYYARRYNLNPAQLDELIARRRDDQARYSEANRAAVIEQARRLNCVLASHDDATAGDVENARQLGCVLAEFPTSMEAARAANKYQLAVIAGAPNLVRGASQFGNVSAAELARAGLLDILSSDYCPSSLLQGVFHLSYVTAIPLHKAVAAAAARPAEILQLTDRGSIVEGKRADLIRVRDTSRGPVVVSAWCAGRQIA